MLRGIYLDLAEATGTPVSYWESLSIPRLVGWIDSYNRRAKKK